MWFLLIINALYTFFYHLHWTIKKKINLDLAVRYKIIYILQQTWWKIHILSDLCLICRPLLHLCQSWRGSSRVHEIIHVYVFFFLSAFYLCVCGCSFWYASAAGNIWNRGEAQESACCSAALSGLDWYFHIEAPSTECTASIYILQAPNIPAGPEMF